MCYDDKIQPLPDWLVDQLENLTPVRCLSALGIHENCEHVTKPVTFPKFEEF